MIDRINSESLIPPWDNDMRKLTPAVNKKDLRNQQVLKLMIDGATKMVGVCNKIRAQEKNREQSEGLST